MTQNKSMYDDRILEENDDEDFQSSDKEEGSCAESEMVDMDETPLAHYSQINKGSRRKIDASQYRADSEINSKDTRNKIMKEVKKAREHGKVMADKHIHENQSESEDESSQRKPVDKNYSNQVEEMSEKPATNILKKTFTSMLSKVY